LSSLSRYLRANAIAFLALFVALGGTGYAIGANTVGATALKSLVVRTSPHVTVPAGGTRFARMLCRSREQFISGAAGWEGANFGDNTPIVHSQFLGAAGSNPTGFLALGRNNGASPRRFFVEVACLKP
jgi:hypothetical protein